MTDMNLPDFVNDISSYNYEWEEDQPQLIYEHSYLDTLADLIDREMLRGGILVYRYKAVDGQNPQSVSRSLILRFSNNTDFIMFKMII